MPGQRIDLRLPTFLINLACRWSENSATPAHDQASFLPLHVENVPACRISCLGPVKPWRQNDQFFFLQMDGACRQSSHGTFDASDASRWILYVHSRIFICGICITHSTPGDVILQRMKSSGRRCFKPHFVSVHQSMGKSSSMSRYSPRPGRFDDLCWKPTSSNWW